jgi:serine/threonine protein kinase
MNNMMKNQFAPNYINKLKLKKMENATEKKKSTKPKLLNLIVPIKPEEEKNNYEIYGELGKGAYGTVRMGMDKRTNEKIAVKIYEKKRLDEPNKIKNLER